MGVIDQSQTQADLPQGKFFPLNWTSFGPKEALRFWRTENFDCAKNQTTFLR